MRWMDPNRYFGVHVAIVSSAFHWALDSQAGLSYLVAHGSARG